MSGLKESLRKIMDSNEEHYAKPCKVLSVDKDNRTCVVEPIDGSAQIPNVRLQATVSQTEGMTLLPKLNSNVLVGFLSKHFAFVCLTDEVDSVLIYSLDVQIGQEPQQQAVKGDDLNANLEKLNENLSALVDLLKVLCNAQQAIASGPLSPLKPAYLQAITSIAQLQIELQDWPGKLQGHLCEHLKVS